MTSDEVAPLSVNTRSGGLLQALDRHRRGLVTGLASTVAMLLGLDILTVFVPGWLPPWLTAQIDLTGTMNAAASFTAAIGILAGLIAGLRGSRSRGAQRLWWFIAGTGFAGLTLVDLLFDHPTAKSFVLAAVIVGVACFWVMRRQLQESRPARMILLLAAAIAISNPLLDRYEIALSGDSDNYEFVSPDEPYRMTTAAWERLAPVRQTQEASEALLLILIVQLLLVDAAGERTGSRAGSASAGPGT